jgi:nitroreductase
VATTVYNLELSVDDEPDRGGARTFDPLETPYALDDRDFPSFGTLEEQQRFLLRYAVLAPSSHNTQPWRVELSDAGIAVYADTTRRLPVADPGDREFLMSVGAFLMNLRVAAARFGFDAHVEYRYGARTGGPVAFMRLVPPALRARVSTPLAPLFPAVVRRRTNRAPFLVTRIPQAVQDELRAVARSSDAGLLLSTDGHLNARVAEIVAQADRLLHADPMFRKELAEWVRPNWTRRGDGITGAAFGVHGVASALGPWATRRLDLGRRQAQHDRNLCAAAPLLAVIHAEDTEAHLIESGELLERLWLTLAGAGLSVSFFNMAIEVPDLRLSLKTLLGLPSWPQLLLRVGYALEEAAASPRRPVEDIIVHQEG